MRRAALVPGLLLIAACGQTGATPVVAPTPAPSGEARTTSGPQPIPGAPISLDELIGGLIEGGDPVCFYNWDATGHCRQYDGRSPGDGTIVAMLRWPGPSRGLYDPDVFLVAANGAWEWAADGFPEKHVRMSSKANETYRVVIMAYGTTPQPFEVRVQFQP